jgi:hypothetical protein
MGVGFSIACRTRIDSPSSPKLHLATGQTLSSELSKSRLSPTTFIRQTKAQIQKAAIYSPTFHLQISNYTIS